MSEHGGQEGGSGEARALVVVLDGEEYDRKVSSGLASFPGGDGTWVDCELEAGPAGEGARFRARLTIRREGSLVTLGVGRGPDRWRLTSGEPAWSRLADQESGWVPEADPGRPGRVRSVSWLFFARAACGGLPRPEE